MPQLEHDEIESREGDRILGSPSKPRPHVRLFLPRGCTLLLPHPRLQHRELAVTMSFIVETIEACASHSNIGGDGLKILGVWLWVKWKTETHGSATVDVG